VLEPIDFNGDQFNSVSLSAYPKESIETDPVLAEALGIRWGWQMVKALNWNTVTILSCHSKSVVASIDHIIKYCKELMSELDITNIVFVKHGLNSVSYSLISLSKHVGCRLTLMLL